MHIEKDKSQRVSIKPDQNRDFIICTDSNDYDSLQMDFNIVLQNIFPDHDDGSLSRSPRRGVRHLNIETS